MTIYLLSRFSAIIVDGDVVARHAEGLPREMEPAAAGEQLVGEGVAAQQGHQTLKLTRILGTQVGGLAQQVLAALDAPHLLVDLGCAESRVDDDGSHLLAHRFQYQLTAVGQRHHGLKAGQVVGVTVEGEHLAQREVGRQLNGGQLFAGRLECVVSVCFHGCVP